MNAHKIGIVSLLFVSLSMFGLTTVAETADGLTPAVEDICTKWGYTGKVNGLCKAYCEAMDCDADYPLASQTACDRVFENIIGELGDGIPFPTCTDSDDDGVPNGIDNCIDFSNADQLDEDRDGIGNACEAPSQCPCNGQTTGNGTTIWSADFLASGRAISSSGDIQVWDDNFSILSVEHTLINGKYWCAISDQDTSNYTLDTLTKVEYDECSLELRNFQILTTE